MNKYADIEQIKEVIRTEWVKYMPMDLDMNLSFVLGKIAEVPTIEVMEYPQVDGITPTVITSEVSEDAISREWLLNAFGLSEKTRKWGGDHSGYDTRMLYEIQDLIEVAPSVIPQPKEGEWIIDEPEEIGYGTIYECPYCKYEVEFVPTNYCPNCGSRMKGEE